MNDVVARLHGYVSEHILEGQDVGLQPSTALLKLGILNSLEIMRLIGFIEQTFGVTVPAEKIVAEHFHSLDTIARLIASLR